MNRFPKLVDLSRPVKMTSKQRAKLERDWRAFLRECKAATRR